MSIQPGEFVALVGVSGAGKSTLLDALNGFRPATGGAVLVNGVDLYQNFDAYRTELGYVPQDDIIHRELTVYKALDYAAQLRMTADTTPAERHRRIMEVLDELDLSERRDVPIHRLSGGQRKRVSIGVELLTKPSLFFLDEATSGLDPGTEAQMMRLLRKLADQGRTIILITHATKNVMICDKVIFLAKGGRLAYYGPPEEALEYFSVQEFDQIYERLESERSPEEWESRYRQSTQYRQFVASRLKNVVSRVGDVQAGLDGRRVGQQSPGSAVKRVSALRQFRVLSARYLNIMQQDRRNLLLLLLLAPILGVSDFITWKRDTFDLVTGDASQAVTMFFIMAIVTILLGCIISVREIVKEVPIYRRERMVSLKLVPYVLSKVWIGFALAAYSAAILLIIKLLAVDFSHLGAADLGKIYVPLALSTMSGVLWGLFISAVSPSEERAMLLIILVLTPQFVFAGGMLPVSELGAPGQALGLVTTSKWALTGMVTAAKVKSGICDGPDLSQCKVPGLQGYPTDAVRANVLQTLDDQYGDIFNADPLVAWSALILLMVGLFLLILIFQKRRDAV